MKVNAIMSRDPACCTAEASLQEVARLMHEHDCGQIPVVESESSRRPVGVITDRDIVLRVIAKGKNPLTLKVSECMTSPAISVKPETGLDDCKKAMEDHRIRRVLVVDDGGRCIGIVSQADIALHGSKGDTAEVVKEVSKKEGPRGKGPAMEV